MGWIIDLGLNVYILNWLCSLSLDTLKGKKLTHPCVLNGVWALIGPQNYLLQVTIVIGAKVIFFFFIIMKEIPAITDQSASKKDFYEILLAQVESICEGQTFWVFFYRVFLLRQYLPPFSLFFY